MSGIYNGSQEDKFREQQLNDYLNQSGKENEPELEITISEELYDKLIEYFENRMDADYEDGRYIASEEMKLSIELHDAFDKSNK